MTDARFDAWLRAYVATCIFLATALLVLGASMYVPSANPEEQRLIEKCLGAHGFPELHWFTGQMTGCGGGK
mgnify:CR=1 FL=1|tara:strand:+ start:3995 stop:4207 length:213 start_codon:yes stop_codon:yes gene_type:complete